MSPVESPKVVLFSTVNVEAVVVERVVPPLEVKDLAKTSPSASIKNFTLPLMAKPKRLVSAPAEEGFMNNEALATLELATSGAQEEKVWAPMGVPVTVNWLDTVEVELMVKVLLLAVKLPETIRGPAMVEVAVPLTFKVPPIVALPEMVAMPPMEVSPVKVDAPDTERVSKVPPDLTVREPLMVALFERVRKEAERRSKPV